MKGKLERGGERMYADKGYAVEDRTLVTPIKFQAGRSLTVKKKKVITSCQDIERRKESMQG